MTHSPARWRRNASRGRSMASRAETAARTAAWSRTTTSGMGDDGTLSALMPATPSPFDLTLAREAFANAAELHAEATRRGAAALQLADFDRLRAADAEFQAA